MFIKHCIGKKCIEKEGKATGFLLLNNIGGYCYFGKSDSRYHGMHCYFDDMYKIISDFFHDNEITGFTNKLNSVVRHRKSFDEEFNFINNCLTYSCNKDIRINLRLDIKKSFDNSDMERYYSFEEQDGIIIIKFQKKDKNYETYIAIDCKDIKYTKKWVEEQYPLDKARNSKPLSRYVYDAFSCSGKKIIISAAKTKKDALKKLKSTKKNKNRKFIKKGDLETSFAYNCAKNSLDGLNIKIKDEFGIFAGLPWFFQLWTRDEAISCSTVKNKKQILFDQIKTILKDGRIPNIRLHTYNGSPNGSADGIGWSFFRLSQCNLGKDKEFVKKQLELSISKLLKYHTKDGFAINDKLETWMDTGKKDTRDGACIEINALRCAMYKLAYKLTKNNKYKKLEQELKTKIKEKFWNNNWLADRLGDFTKRPNVFIACYVYPELLTNKEWITCFENILPALWLEWGGLSTIDKNNILFNDTYSGEDPTSYHRGDSWFWINNLAAIVMTRINFNKLKKYISKIFQASKNEILWQGMIGHASELSSAKELRSEASLCQAWSNAMFIELIDELN